MELQNIRRLRIKQLVEEYGSQTALAEKLEIEQNYVSRVLSGAKRIGEDFAARVEERTGKPRGWLSGQEKRPVDWPFAFDRSHWDSLPADEREQLEQVFRRMVLAAEADLSKSKKRAS